MRLWLIVALALLGALRAHVMRPLQSLLHRDSEASQRPHEINHGLDRQQERKHRREGQRLPC